MASSMPSGSHLVTMALVAFVVVIVVQKTGIAAKI